MEQNQQTELIGVLKILTHHYSTHSIVDAESTEHEYKCFVASVLFTSHLKRHKN